MGSGGEALSCVDLGPRVHPKIFRMKYLISCNYDQQQTDPHALIRPPLTEYVVCPHEYSLKNNGILIRSAIFAQYARVTDRETTE